MSNQTGQMIESRFRVDDLIGEGQMGKVYRAIDVKLERMVAIKVLNAEYRDNPQFVARFHREAKIIAQLSSNPHVVTIYDIGTTNDGLPCLVTEFLDGHCLSIEIESGGSISRTWTLDVTMQILSALIDTHAKGVVHRDLKPANIFVTSAQASPLHAKVLDFGLASAVTIPLTSELETQSGAVMGTPKYMAPEVLAGDIAAPHSDIYSLGIIVYELATGAYPYEASSLTEFFRAHLVSTAAPFPTHAVPFPSEFEELVLRMLSKETSDRPNARDCARIVSRVSTKIDDEKRQRILGK